MSMNLCNSCKDVRKQGRANSFKISARSAASKLSSTFIATTCRRRRDARNLPTLCVELSASASLSVHSHIHTPEICCHISAPEQSASADLTPEICFVENVECHAFCFALLMALDSWASLLPFSGLLALPSFSPKEYPINYARTCNPYLISNVKKKRNCEK